jgi:hypothetical protein
MFLKLNDDLWDPDSSRVMMRLSMEVNMMIKH